MFSQSGSLRIDTFQNSFPVPVVVAPSLQSLFSRQPVEKFAIGSAIFWEDDAAKDVFEVIEGVLRVFKILTTGGG